MEELLRELRLEKYAQPLSEAGYETGEGLAAVDEDALMMDTGMLRPEARRICRHFKGQQGSPANKTGPTVSTTTTAPKEGLPMLPGTKKWMWFGESSMRSVCLSFCYCGFVPLILMLFVYVIDISSCHT